MIVKTAKSIMFAIFWGAFCHNIAAQVTIGSLKAPVSGALLDLKEENTTTRGLGLPRVKLLTNKSLEPCLTTSESADTYQREIHIGLVVYNVGTEIDGTTEEDRLCKGLHVWNGDQWQPLIPYPQFVNTLAGPREELIDRRGPSGYEINLYSTAYFIAYKNKTSGKSLVVCNLDDIVAVDAGQWMTMNLQTRYAFGETTPLDNWDNGKDEQKKPQYTIPINTGLAFPTGNREIRLNGYQYNWVAATAGKDLEILLDINERTLDHPQIQGICPQGWHLPSMKEWELLVSAIRTQPHLFGNTTSTKTNAYIDNYVSTFNGGASFAPEQGGFDFRLLGTAYQVNAVQTKGTHANEPYNTTGFAWTSSLYKPDPIGYAGRSHSFSMTKGSTASADFALWKNGKGSSVFLAYRSRVMMEAVRCKKD